MTSLLLTLSIAQSQLTIDPLLVQQAAEIWNVIARKDNPIWPGWNATHTPLLIYMPGKQDVLINHPKPPPGFVPYTGPVKFPGGRIFIKNGPTLIQFDGQNTATDVNGVQTLVVADTMSSRRQWLENFAAQAKGTSDLKSTIDSNLEPNPLDSMLMFAHEAFHVFQHSVAKDKAGNEMALVKYPSLSVDNNAGYNLEAAALREAIRAKDPRPAAIRWLAIRQERRKALDPKLVAYEDGTEFNEGLAKYVEWKALEVLKTRKPIPEMWLVQGFRGYEHSEKEQDRLLNAMDSIMTGRTNINNDPFGASPVRFRLYYSGMGVAALLDRLGMPWKKAILEDKAATLTSLATAALKASPGELEAAWSAVRASDAHSKAVESRQKLATDGEVHIKEVLGSFDAAPASLALDHSKIEKPQIGFSFTPFGLLRVDDQRCVFRLLPLRGVVNSLGFSEDTARPVLDDRTARTVLLTLTAAVDESLLDRVFPGWRTGPVDVKEAALPGVTLKNVKGTIRLDGKRVRVVVAE